MPFCLNDICISLSGFSHCGCSWDEMDNVGLLVWF